MRDYQTVAMAADCQLTVRKSKFIAYVNQVIDEQAITNFLLEIKKQHPTATHHCYAYRLLGDVIKERYDDNKEPAKTAGLPILQVLTGYECYNLMVIVVRYYGGIKLGTGGLVKAYSEVAKQVLEKAGLVIRQVYHQVEFILDYRFNDSFSYLVEQEAVAIAEVIYTDKVTWQLYLKRNKVQEFIEKAMDLTIGQINYQQLKEIYGYQHQGQFYG